MKRIVLIMVLMVFCGSVCAEEKKKDNTASDLRNLSEFLEQQGRSVGWMKINAKADLGELLEAPYILFHGFKAPKFDSALTAKLQKYLAYGGSIFGMARVAKKQGNMFEKPFIKLAEDMCPGMKMKKLPDDHPVYSIKHKIPAPYRCLSAIEDDCRIIVLYSSRNLFKGYKSRRDEKEKLSDGMQLMENISEYIAASGALREKLDRVFVVTPTPVSGIRPGMLVIPQLVSKPKEYRHHTMALPMLLEELWRRDKIRTAAVDKAITFAELDTKKYPLVYVCAKKWGYTKDEEKLLAKYLRDGGKVFAEALGGSEDFDRGCRGMIAEFFKNETVKTADKDHYLMMAVNRPWIIQPTPELKKKYGKRKLREPLFEILSINEKPAMVYSPYDLGCGWSDYPCYKRLGYSKRNAMSMARKIVKFLSEKN